MWAYLVSFAGVVVHLLRFAIPIRARALRSAQRPRGCAGPSRPFASSRPTARKRYGAGPSNTWISRRYGWLDRRVLPGLAHPFPAWTQTRPGEAPRAYLVLAAS